MIDRYKEKKQRGLASVVLIEGTENAFHVVTRKFDEVSKAELPDFDGEVTIERARLLLEAKGIEFDKFTRETAARVAQLIAQAGDLQELVTDLEALTPINK